MNRATQFEERVVSSALWAAAGDALGWITELTDERGLKRRTRGKGLVRPVAWRRKIGGMTGPDVRLPAGTYSDDTQLRLAVCRSIRGDGAFDVEAFAKIELTVWPAYALGAGRGTKAAASNLQRRDVAWFSNFFTSQKGPTYTQAGGNGAAMRVQPHVWRCGVLGASYVKDVVRDAIVTHGHIYGIYGAVFHADCLAYALENLRAPGPDDWRRFVGNAGRIEEAILNDDQLRRFWLTAWESASGVKFRAALDSARSEMLSDIERITALEVDKADAYSRAIEALDGFGARQGTGTNTALAAAYASWLMGADQIEAALIEIASVLGSDTDTIATMAGAILGATNPIAPTWEIQDKDYIVSEARRLARIANGARESSFAYPDLASWVPPSAHSDVLSASGRRVAVAGMGDAEVIDEAGVSGGYQWLWMRLRHGQTILCKARTASHSGNSAQLTLEGTSQEAGESQGDLLISSHERQTMPNARSNQNEAVPARDLSNATIDELTNYVISRGFDQLVLGECLHQCLQHEDGLERAVAFSAIVAKAYVTRRRAADRSRG